MLTKEEVNEVAALARIELTDEEQQHFQGELSQVIDFFDELQSINTSDVDAIGHITGRLSEARSDIPVSGNSGEEEQIKKNFPENEDDYLAVKSVF